ncbi:MAG: radical SAM protein [Candidatus Competibacteraceae bacterium]|nr:radical SAM protein [Candidatus Competibacteraceae bacterium]
MNLRMGLATNSSSTHSLIFVDRRDGIYDTTTGDFGWGYFTAVSPEVKKRYLGALLAKSLQGVMPSHIAETVAKSWVRLKNPDGVTFDYSSEEDGVDGCYIDHQSVYILPAKWGTNAADPEFFDELHRYFLDDRLVILGGNDNDGDDHPLANGSDFVLPIPRDYGSGEWVCRKDPLGNYWTLFSRVEGTKIRMRFFDDNGEPVVPEAGGNNVPQKAFAPELVDVKITDYCPFDCAFCYQDSTKDGKHADADFLTTLGYALGEMQVLEVAIGGGEPTMHPQFLSFCNTLKYGGVVANFTTKNLAWLKDDKMRNKILETTGGFAFSPTKREDVKALHKLVEKYGIAKDRVSIHLVMGTMNEIDFEYMLRNCADARFRVTLLGYKTTGRGSQVEAMDYGFWLKVVKRLMEKHKCPSLGVDTVLAAAYEKEILEADVPSWLFTVKEGAFSMYIDAVNRTAGASSFVPKEEMKPLDERATRNLVKSIMSEFATYQ